MKKITLIAAAVLASTTMASAQGTIGNPKDPNAEGKYIVAYDIKNNKWCDANPKSTRHLCSPSTLPAQVSKMP